MNDDLLTAEEVSKMIGHKGPRYVRERLVLNPTFPKAIRWPTPGGGHSHPRWKASEIKAWVDKLAA